MAEEVRPGRLVGDRYRLVAELGAGSFGRVWTAHDERLDTVVAVKEVRLPSWGTPQDRAERLARAEREGRNAVRLRDHPNVVTVHDVVTEDDAPWIVMRLVTGISLKDQLDAAGRLPTAQVVHLATGLLAALSAAHAAGIVHRDVKPGNVLLSTTGEVLLTDFGIAVHRADSTVTVPGMVVGTLAYTAPERFAGTDDAAGDLFSLGVVLYEAMTGACPFHRDSTTAALHAVLHHEPPPPAGPPALSRLVTGLLAKQPHERLAVPAARELLTGLAAEPVPVGLSASEHAGRLLPRTRVLPSDETPRDDGSPGKPSGGNGSGKGERAAGPKGAAGGSGAGKAKGGAKGGSAGDGAASGTAEPGGRKADTGRPASGARKADTGRPASGARKTGAGKAKADTGKPGGRNAGAGGPKPGTGKPGPDTGGSGSGARKAGAGTGKVDAGQGAGNGTSGQEQTAAPGTTPAKAAPSSDNNGWMWVVGLVIAVIVALYAYNRDARDAATGDCVYTTDHKKLKREPCSLHWPGGTSYRVLQRFQPAAVTNTCASVAGWDRLTDTSWYWPATTKDEGVLLCLDPVT